MLVWLAMAHAQDLDAGRPLVPGSSVAAEDGPAAYWFNPANAAYDPDRRLGLFFNRQPGPEQTDLALVGGQGPLTLGALTRSDPAGTRWALQSSAAFLAPKRVAMGGTASWVLQAGRRSFVAFDVGVGWRPLPWLGLAGSARNLGSPDPTGSFRGSTTAGIALRPAGDSLTLSLDAGRVAAANTLPAEDLLATQLRARLAEGLYLRAGGRVARSREASVWRVNQLGGALEAYFGGGGGGAGALTTEDGLSPIGWLGTTEPGESLLVPGRVVPAINLNQPFPTISPPGTWLSPAPPSWLDLMERLRAAESARGVEGLVVTLGGAELGWARTEELIARFQALRAAGRPVIAVLSGEVSMQAWMAASWADEVVLHPAGAVQVEGLGTDLITARGALQWLGIHPDFVRRSEYKSAVELFTHTQPSAPSVEQARRWLTDRRELLVSNLMQGRDKPREVVEAWLSHGPFTADEALEQGLVDHLLYADELDPLLAQTYQGDVQVIDLTRRPLARGAWEDPVQIALIPVEGVILSGSPSPLQANVASTGTILRALESAREDPLVRAVVLRIDSPGGSALASDEIAHAIERVQRSGKPVVASMAEVAASGGYYVAAPCDAIWAEASTLTGSIGVFQGKLSGGDLLERLGVHITEIALDPHAGADSPLHGWTGEQRERTEALVEATYRRFKAQVAQGRSMTEVDVEALAGGRVFTGRQAIEVGLVDELGGLLDALLDARDRAGIPEGRQVGVILLDEDQQVFEQLGPSREAAQRLTLPSLGPVADTLLPLLTSQETLWTLDLTLIHP